MNEHIAWAKNKNGHEIPEWGDQYDTRTGNPAKIWKIPIWEIILVLLVLTSIVCGVTHNEDGTNVSMVCTLFVGLAYGIRSMVIHFDQN